MGSDERQKSEEEDNQETTTKKKQEFDSSAKKLNQNEWFLSSICIFFVIKDSIIKNHILKSVKNI